MMPHRAPDEGLAVLQCLCGLAHIAAAVWMKGRVDDDAHHCRILATGLSNAGRAAPMEQRDAPFPLGDSKTVVERTIQHGDIIAVRGTVRASTPVTRTLRSLTGEESVLVCEQTGRHWADIALGRMNGKRDTTGLASAEIPCTIELQRSLCVSGGASEGPAVRSVAVEFGAFRRAAQLHQSKLLLPSGFAGAKPSLQANDPYFQLLGSTLWDPSTRLASGTSMQETLMDSSAGSANTMAPTGFRGSHGHTEMVPVNSQDSWYYKLWRGLTGVVGDGSYVAHQYLPIGAVVTLFGRASLTVEDGKVTLGLGLLPFLSGSGLIALLDDPRAVCTQLAHRVRWRGALTKWVLGVGCYLLYESAASLFPFIPSPFHWMADRVADWEQRNQRQRRLNRVLGGADDGIDGDGWIPEEAGLVEVRQRRQRPRGVLNFRVPVPPVAPAAVIAAEAEGGGDDADSDEDEDNEGGGDGGEFEVDDEEEEGDEDAPRPLGQHPAVADIHAAPGEDECVVCRVNRPQVAFVPCGHLAVCIACAVVYVDEHALRNGDADMRCAICNMPAQGLMKVFGMPAPLPAAGPAAQE